MECLPQRIWIWSQVDTSNLEILPLTTAEYGLRYNLMRTSAIMIIQLSHHILITFKSIIPAESRL